VAPLAAKAIHAGCPLTVQVGVSMVVVAERTTASPSVTVAEGAEAVTADAPTASANVLDCTVAASPASVAL
jgi:hypothetical protein